MIRLELEKRSALADALVSATAARARLRSTVVAVGGYGRRELFPFSDVDLLLLSETAPPAEAERKATGEFIRDLWDAGLRASQSVHTAAECCEVREGNLELTISLLDSRFVTGERAPYDALEKRFAKFLAGERASIVRHLCAMTRGRHQRHGDTIYILEPNIKEHPGGLRDLHTLRWMRRLGARVEENLEAEEEFLFSVRIFLHQRYGRDNNLLSFEAQEAIAADPAAWMREYYRNARAIFRATVRALRHAEEEGAGLLTQFRERRGRLSNADFTVVRERVLLREPGLFQSDPAAMFRLLEFVARHGLALAPDTEKRLSDALPSLAGAGSWWKPLHAVLESPGAATAFRALHEAGLMPALVPEWKRIDALVARDFYHRYTVDEHTIVALESLAALSASEDPARRRFADLMAEAGDLSALRLALLLHDIGKGGGTGEHAGESARIAAEALRRMDAPEEVSAAALFLIERHLDLSAVIDSRDLDDPATARIVAKRTGSIERLRLLTLMTYADISAVNPTAMTPWRLDQLWRLYLVAHEEFTRELQSERIGPREAGSGDGVSRRLPHAVRANALDGPDSPARRAGRRGSRTRSGGANRSRDGLFSRRRRIARPPRIADGALGSDIELRAGHLQGRSVFERRRRRAEHLRLLRSASYAGVESDRGGALARDAGERGHRGGGRGENAEGASASEAVPGGRDGAVGALQRGSLRHCDADRDRGGGPSGFAARAGIGVVGLRPEHRSGAD